MNCEICGKELKKGQKRFCSKPCNCKGMGRVNLGKPSWSKDKQFSITHRQNLSESHKGYVMPQSQKDKISIGSKNSTQAETNRSPARRARAREVMLTRLENGTAPRKLFNTKPELKMKDILRDIGLKVGKAKEDNDVVFQKRLHNKMIDFWHRRLNLYINVDGNYHHNLSEIKELDKERNEIIIKEGAWYITFWSNDIMKESNLVKDTLVRLGVTK
jgi:very-short-patch-repair endonuclease